MIVIVWSLVTFDSKVAVKFGLEPTFSPSSQRNHKRLPEPTHCIQLLISVAHGKTVRSPSKSGNPTIVVYTGIGRGLGLHLRKVVLISIRSN